MTSRRWHWSVITGLPKWRQDIINMRPCGQVSSQRCPITARTLSNWFLLPPGAPPHSPHPAPQYNYSPTLTKKTGACLVLAVRGWWLQRLSFGTLVGDHLSEWCEVGRGLTQIDLPHVPLGGVWWLKSKVATGDPLTWGREVCVGGGGDGGGEV